MAFQYNPRVGPRVRRGVVSLVALGLMLTAAGYTFAQFRGGRGFELLGLRSTLAPEQFPDGDFVICRLVYNEVRRFGRGWRTDHPLGERNLSIRFAELTRTRVSRAPDGSPRHYVVRLTDDQLFQCPLLMAGDIGSIGLSELEAARLRAYLLKGGFLWTDDMWGEAAWQAWTGELRKVFDPAEYPIEDVPVTDPIFRAQFVVEKMPQIPNIGYWRATGGTSEEGAESAVPVFRAVRDRHGRIMVAMTHNTDIADAFEREADDPQFFYLFSPNGYALGVNVLLHALTH